MFGGLVYVARGTTYASGSVSRRAVRTRLPESVDGVPGLADDARTVWVVLAEGVGDHLTERLARRDVRELQDRRRRRDRPATDRMRARSETARTLRYGGCTRTAGAVGHTARELWLRRTKHINVALRHVTY